MYHSVHRRKQQIENAMMRSEGGNSYQGEENWLYWLAGLPGGRRKFLKGETSKT